MTKTRDLANLIADSKVGPSEIDTAGNYEVNQLGIGSALEGGYGSLQLRGSFAYVNEDGSDTKQLYIRSDFGSNGPAIQVATAHPLRFITNNNWRAEIQSTGDLNLNSGIGLRMNGTTIISSTQNLYLSGQIDQTKNSNGSYINQFENESTGTSAYVETQWINSNSQLRVGTSRNYADPWQGAWLYADTQDLLIKAGGSGKAIKFYAGNVDDIRASITSSSLNLNIDATIKLSNYNTPAFTIQRYNNADLELFAFGEYDGGTGTPWGGSSWGAAVIHTHNRNMVFSTASSDFTDLVDGDAAMFIGYDDQIGIGNTDPAARLHVTHNDTWTLLLERTGGTPHMQFRNSGDGGNYSFIWSEYGSGFKWGQRLSDGSNETVYLQSNGSGQLTTNNNFSVTYGHATALAQAYSGTQSYVPENGDFIQLHNDNSGQSNEQYASIWAELPQYVGTSGSTRSVRFGGKSVARNYSADFFVQTRGKSAQLRTRMTVGEEGIMRDYTGNTSSKYKWFCTTADDYTVEEYDFGNRLYLKKNANVGGYSRAVFLNRYLPADFDMTFEIQGGQASTTYRHFGIILNGNGNAASNQWDYIVLRQHSTNSSLNQIRWDDGGTSRNSVENSSVPNFWDGAKRRVRVEKRYGSLRVEVAGFQGSNYTWGTHTGLSFTAPNGGYAGFVIYENGAADTWVEVSNLMITEV